ncbi:uncharacterized protein LOC131884750 isoform X2 [Tigriopus californicus]|uniref:uncharacterized protein LOC131884750 isoform X2 n=1 Tax=Tigriopus californicus TaxID=6832 RepID=UPI0027DA2FF3|nr:uncharacterized protein LOC131884750 isoform X2 [Tigriopus californicus]
MRANSKGFLSLLITLPIIVAYREDFFPDSNGLQDYRSNPASPINPGRAKLSLPSNVLGEINLKQRTGGGNFGDQPQFGPEESLRIPNTIDEVARDLKQEFAQRHPSFGSFGYPMGSMQMPTGAPWTYPMPIPIPYIMPIYMPMPQMGLPRQPTMWK